VPNQAECARIQLENIRRKWLHLKPLSHAVNRQNKR
jgi:hypothetical protein